MRGCCKMSLKDKILKFCENFEWEEVPIIILCCDNPEVSIEEMEEAIRRLSKKRKIQFLKADKTIVSGTKRINNPALRPRFRDITERGRFLCSRIKIL